MESLVEKTFKDLFPLNRGLTGRGVLQSFDYIIDNFLPLACVKSIKSGQQVYDWTIPEEWNCYDAYVINGKGDKIIDFNKSNLHVVSNSTPVNKTVSGQELLNHLHSLPKFPSRIPYRTSYYEKTWGFCCADELIKSDRFIEPFEVRIDSELNPDGNLNWLECVKKGKSEKEILISSYCCHPSLANDNLSGFVLAAMLFEYLQSLDTQFTYRLVIVPETIGAIAFLSQANLKHIVGGMVCTCVAGPGKISIKEGFDKEHFINKTAHLALQENCGTNYLTYPFVPDGSDERQYSTPGFRIVTPSIHKCKYYEYDEYHTSDDNLSFINAKWLLQTLDVYKSWINQIELYCIPIRKNMFCEFQLGKRGLYPNIGGSINQKADFNNDNGNHKRHFKFSDEVNLSFKHLEAFHWLMHLADGNNSNIQISEKSGIEYKVINEAIAAMWQKGLIDLS